MIVWIGVALLGGVGACGRFLPDRAIAVRAFPLGTMVVNLTGAFLLGVLLGVDGTVHGERRRASFFGGNGGVPVMLIAVGAGEAAVRALEALDPPLFTLERICVCRRDGVALAEPEPRAGEWHKLMLHSSDHVAHEALVRRLRGAGTAGATTLRGVWGYHGDHEPHGDRVLQTRRGVPAITVIVDTPEQVARSFEIVSELTPERGLVTSETVPVILE